jgi:folate-binding protein YgfZ
VTIPSPLIDDHRAINARLLAYGDGETTTDLVETFGELDFEYAALRAACLLVDRAQLGVLDVTGDDRVSFLNSMLTQKIEDVPFSTVRTFWLNRKGRIVADIVACVLPDRIRLLTDVLTLPALESSLNDYIITEDVELSLRPDLHAIDVIGPTGAEVVQAKFPELVDVPSAGECRICSTDSAVVAHNDTGAPGLTVIQPADDAAAFWRSSVEQFEAFAPGADHDLHALENDSPKARVRLRRGGWAAWNVARIEAGTPVMLVDFGSESLPGETGVLRDRVDFKKGCYLGQEVVARMDALGHPKQCLVALKLRGTRATAPDGVARQPIGGAPVFQHEPEHDSPPGPVVGRVTSSTISPMLGATAIAFAQVRWGNQEAGTELLIEAEGEAVDAVVLAQLRSMPSDEPSGAVAKGTIES